MSISALDRGKGKSKEKGQKTKNNAITFEVIPEHAVLEMTAPGSFIDESPNDDDDVQYTEQEEVSRLKRKRKRSGTSMETKESAAQPSEQNSEEMDKPCEKKSRKRTAECWRYLEDVQIDGKSYAKCKFCGKPLVCNNTRSTSTFNRHVEKCLAKHGQSMQTKLAVQRGINKEEVSLSTFKYDHALMRETLSHYIMICELPFIHVESFMFNKLMSTATPYWQKITRGTSKSDCKTTYEIEKKKLIEKFKHLKRVNITTDMWTSSNQKVGYMVITSHWIDDEWKLNTRILNFCNVPPPHSGYVIAEEIHKCLADWGIIEKIGTITVDNAKANDLAIKNLKETFNIRKCLPLKEINLKGKEINLD